MGLCVPGLLAEDRRTVLHSVNLPGLSGLRMDDLVSAALEATAFANIHDDRGPLDLSRLTRELSEIEHQVHRQIVHAVIAKILKDLQRGDLA